MANDWLLVETLGSEPVVVAEGTEPKNLVPLNAFLRRRPGVAAIRTAIAETVQTGQSLASITPKTRRVIRTEPVRMTDGKVHGVHVWSGPADTEPPDRAIPGPLIWDLTLGVAIDTPQSLVNCGVSPEDDAVHGGAFIEDLPTRAFSSHEDAVLAQALTAETGETLCGGWNITDWDGGAAGVYFVVRIGREAAANGHEHLIARGMNWHGDPEPETLSEDVAAVQDRDTDTDPAALEPRP